MSLCGSKIETDAFLSQWSHSLGGRDCWGRWAFASTVGGDLLASDPHWQDKTVVRNQYPTTQESLIPQLFLISTHICQSRLHLPESMQQELKKNTSRPLRIPFDQLFSGWASRGALSDLYPLPTTTTNEKQCAWFDYTANPISCFTLCRRVAERGDEWDGTGAVLTQIPQSPNMGCSHRGSLG